MTLFIMYMAGNTISLFPIMMVGMMFLKPVKALFSISSGKDRGMKGFNYGYISLPIQFSQVNSQVDFPRDAPPPPPE
jgi:hypothetical protein